MFWCVIVVHTCSVTIYGLFVFRTCFGLLSSLIICHMCAIVFTASFTIRDMAVRARQTLDVGFAWVVLFAIFCVMVLLGIMQYSAGVLNTAILEEIDNDLSKTSWVGSTMLGTLTLTGKCGFVSQYIP